MSLIVKEFQGGKIIIDYKTIINYASLLNGNNLIESLSIKLDEPCRDLNIFISGNYFDEYTFLERNETLSDTLDVECGKVIPSLQQLISLNDAIYTEFQISIVIGIKKIATFKFPLTILPWNHWNGINSSLEEIASFVLPNHKYISEIISRARGELDKISSEKSFFGYDYQAKGDVIEQVRAIWNTLLKEKISFLTCSVSYVDEGQQIITPEKIKSFRQGNCLDLTLLFCGCLERIGLMPCLIFLPGHVLTGVWLEPSLRNDSVVIDDSELICRMSKDKPTYLLCIETTDLTRGLSLDDAVINADAVIKPNLVRFMVDVLNARNKGIRPLPVLNSIQIPDKEYNEIAACSGSFSESGRIQSWERRLLDLSLRNPMLNLKTGKHILPLWETEISIITQKLKEGLISELIGETDKDNHDSLKELYRASRNSIEENGANNLFLSLGTLRWYDVDDKKEHLAPLIFIPINIVRKKAMTYNIMLRDEDPVVNVTLLEMLHRMFGIDLSNLNTIPLDSDGIPEWKKIYEVFQDHITEINKRQPADKQWELPVKSYIGIFSFTKFLLWNDIHANQGIIENHPILKNLINNYWKDKDLTNCLSAVEIEKNNHENLILPLNYDSSQLEAIAMSDTGQSFVLYGPPGTGKSQTITNMIANAVAKGKRVLFVAEKKAALDVVKTRLEKIGIGPYCLELHSNKSDKRSFFNRLKSSKISVLGTEKDYNEKYETIDKERLLDKYRCRLYEINEAIHAKREENQNLSLYNHVTGYLETGYTKLFLRFEDINHISLEQLKELTEEIRSLDLITHILGYHPSESNLIGLYPLENTADNQITITDILKDLPVEIQKSRKKAISLLNKWIFKKTAKEYLEKNPLWIQLNTIARLDFSEGIEIDDIQNSVSGWNSALDELRKWYLFAEKANSILDKDGRFALKHYLKGLSGENVSQEIQSAYHKAHAYNIIDKESYLRGFNGEMHEIDLKKYRKKVDENRLKQIERLCNGLEASIKKCRLNPEDEKKLTQLKRRMLTNGRGISLRKIFTDSGDVIHKIFPCMLMSPLSVAQFLEMKQDIFDLVIFDEASQMETPDAIGVIARGKSIVIVGDPNQLPPTRFFMSRTLDGEEIEETEETESILEDCIVTGMNSRYLARHYRSGHESLIDFSNKHFYQNKLMTFPSYNDCEKKVSLIDSNGIYDSGKTRTNRKEAELVVEKIIEIFEKAEGFPSVGVVAFSKAQSSLIEDILISKMRRNKELRQKIENTPEPLFIKNLENVQGDERDLIILSVGYGPDKYGNVTLNFGPINQKGGERRLNVAVSRAREEMIVFSSLKYFHIPDGNGLSEGVRLLRAFLCYASSTEKEKYNNEASKERDEIIENIADELRNRGLFVDINVGRSSFKIDLAIKSSEDSNNYILGIIIDGETYASLPTVRDREYTVPTVLKSLGWHIKRVWVIDWFENHESVIQSILEELNIKRSKFRYHNTETNK